MKRDPDCICEYVWNRRVPSDFCPVIHPIDFFREDTLKPYSASRYTYTPDGTKVELRDERNDR